MLPWEKQPMLASQFCSVPKGTGQLSCTYKRLLDCWEKMCISGWELGWLARRFEHFLGSGTDYYPYLHKFWAEHPCWGKLHNSCWEFWLEELHNIGAQQAARQDCTISRGKAGFPLEMYNFLGEATQPTVGPSLSEHLVRGMLRAVINKLPLCKQNNEACEPDEAKQAVVKVGREAPKQG